MARRYEGKVTLIAGGARGIGKGCVLEFVKEGALVVFCDIIDEVAKATENEANAISAGKCSYIHCDMKKEEEIKSLIQKTVELHGQLDCIVNVAGWHPPELPIDDFSIDDFKDLLSINLVSMFCTSKYGLPHLRQTKGNIINISSQAAIAQYRACTYSATKGGIVSLTKSLALDEGQNGVRVNCVSPAAIHTELMDEWLKTSTVKDVESLAKNTTVLGRMGTPAEIGKACVYLAADATFCTGTDLAVSAGWELPRH